MTLDMLKDLAVTNSKVDVHKLYVDFIQLDKQELVNKLIHLTLCVEGLGNVIGNLNDVMFAVADKLNRSHKTY